LNDTLSRTTVTPAEVAALAAIVPAALRAHRQWVCWKYIKRQGKQTKCPINPRDGGGADSTDSSTWTSFDEAVATWHANDRYAGVGFVFAADDPFTGVDLDGCIDDDGAIVPGAREIIDSLNSYTEVSPSGRGVKVFIIGQKPDGCGCKSKKIEGYKETEIYSRERYFTFTGRHVAGTPLTVEDRQSQLDSLCQRLWPARLPRHLNGTAASAGFTGDDEALIQRAGAAKNGDRFKTLWAGDTSLHAGDDSAADQALCNHLAFWTGKDAARMDRLFRRSGLFRAKWDEQRGDRTYGRMTIEFAIASCTEVYSPRRRRGPRGVEAPASHGADGPIEADEQEIALGQRDPKTGRLVLSPKRTLPTAEAYIGEFHQHTDARTLHGYAGLLVEWRDNRYCQVEDEWIRHRLQPWLHGALRYVPNGRTGEMQLVDFESNPSTVEQALDTIRSAVHLPASTVSPSWLGDQADLPPALEILPCKSLNLHIPTGRVLPATPALFTIIGSAVRYPVADLDAAIQSMRVRPRKDPIL